MKNWLKKLIRFFKSIFKRPCEHDFELREVYGYPEIVLLPVWGKRLEKLQLFCKKCGQYYGFDVPYNIYKIDWHGTYIAQNKREIKCVTKT